MLLIFLIIVAAITFFLFFVVSELKKSSGESIMPNDKYTEKRIRGMKSNLLMLNILANTNQGTKNSLRDFYLERALREVIQLQLLTVKEFQSFEAKIKLFSAEQSNIHNAKINSNDQKELLEKLGRKVDEYFNSQLNLFKERAKGYRNEEEKVNIKNRIDSM